MIVNTDDQTKLAGTLTIPHGAGPFPAVILISGSGAQDRGAGESGGVHRATTTAVRAVDVGRMIDCLLTRKEIDRKRIFLLGHSEGTVIASMVASRNPHPAGIILLGAPGLSIEENLHLQNTLIRKAEGAGDGAIAQANVLQRRIFSVVKGVADDGEARAKLREIYSSNMFERLTDSQKKSIDERIAASDGKFLWRYDRPANRMGINCSTPLHHDGMVFAASAYGAGGGAVKLSKDGNGGVKAEEVWFSRNMEKEADSSSPTAPDCRLGRTRSLPMANSMFETKMCCFATT